MIRGEAAPAEVRALVHRLDPHQPVAGPRRLAEHLEEVTGTDRMAALVMGYFAVLGVLLVSVGVHGGMQRFVGQQHRAIGTRMAFGAEPWRIAGTARVKALPEADSPGRPRLYFRATM